MLGGFAFDSTQILKIETQNQVIRLGNVKTKSTGFRNFSSFIDDKYVYEVENLYLNKTILNYNDRKRKPNEIIFFAMLELR